MTHVLVVSTKLDVATDAVVRLLSQRNVRCTRLNTEDFPFDSSLTTALSPGSGAASISYQTVSGIDVPFEDASSLWYRRVRVPERPEHMNSGIYDFCLREARDALVGTLLTWPIRAMSPPDCVWAAEHKLYQLAIARSVGLVIPDTVVTNDPAKVREAYHRFDRQMVAKAVRVGFLDYESEQRAIFTSQVLDEHLNDLESAKWSPTIYQRLIPKRCDIRVTAVGTKLFVAEIDSQSDPAGRIDWRRSQNSNLPHRPGHLPDDVRRALIELLSKLGLSFAAVDFVKSVSGQYIFLEVNPSGQRLWLEDLLQFPIAASIADWLSSPNGFLEKTS